jgi:hypothetical protein
LVEFIDRVWIEQRIYHLENQLYTQQVYKTDRLGTEELLQNTPNRNSVVFAEIDQCSWILQTPPFPWSPRMPKENEIYAIEMSLNLWRKKFLGSFTPRNFASQGSSIRHTPASMTSAKPPNYARPPSQASRTDLSPSPKAKRRKVWDTEKADPIPRNFDSDIVLEDYRFA